VGSLAAVGDETLAGDRGDIECVIVGGVELTGLVTGYLEELAITGVNGNWGRLRRERFGDRR